MDVFTPALVFAQQDVSRPKNLLIWMYESLGLFYGMTLPLTGFLVFVGACLVVARCQRPAVIAAYVVFLPLPLLIGVMGTADGLITSFSVVALAGGEPTLANIAEGLSASMFTTLVGLLVTFPSYLVVAAGLFLRTLFSPSSSHREAEVLATMV